MNKQYLIFLLPLLLVLLNSSLSSAYGLNTSYLGKDVYYHGSNASLLDEPAVTDGLVAYWAFDEGSGTTAHDTSGNDNDGTINGANWTTGKFGSALSFDGVDDYVDCGTNWNSLLNGGISDFTIEAWVKYPSQGQHVGIVGDYVDNLDVGVWLGSIYEKITLRMKAEGTPSGSLQFSTDESYNDNTWHHIVFVADRDDLGSIYVDGTFRKSTDISAHNASLGTETIKIGYIYRHFNGTIDEVRIYNRALSPEEIREQYRRGYSRLSDAEVRNASLTGYNGTELYLYLDNDNVSSQSGQFKISNWVNAAIFYNSSAGTWRNISELADIGMGYWNYITNVSTFVNYTLAGADGYEHGLRDEMDYGNASWSIGSTWLNKSGSSLDEGLVLDLHFEENSGNTTYDASGHGNDGTLYNGSVSCYNGDCPTWTTGKFGSALSFDGENDYVDCGNDTSLDITDEITIEAWVYPLRTGINEDFVTKRVADSDAAYRSYSLLQRTTNDFQFRIGTETTWGYASTSAVKNQWVHLVGTYDGSQIIIYKNGIASTPTSFSGDIKVDTSPLYIATLDTSLAMFNGTIDEVRIYNRALSAEEIKQRYEQTRLKYENDFLTARITEDSLNVSDYEGNALYELFVPSIEYDNKPLYYTYPKPNRALYYYDWSDQEYKILRQGGEEQHRDGLVLELKMNENSGNTTYDSSIYSNNGTCHNMNGGTGVTDCDWTVGRTGYGIEFDGSDDYIDCGNDTSLDITDEITVEAWVKPEAGLTNSYFVLKDDQVSKRCWGLKIGNDSKFGWFVWDSDSVVKSCYADNILSYDKWYHVVGTYDGSMQKIYVDGILQTNTSSWSGTIKSEPTQPVAISGDSLKKPSDNLRRSNDTEIWDWCSTSWGKRKTITFSNGIKGTLRVKFDMLTSADNPLGWGRVYKNGVPIGTTQQNTIDDTWETFSEDIDFGTLDPGDTIELWGKGNAGGCVAFRNFRIYYDNDTNYFNGTIDEVRIYSRALTEDEIRAHYVNGAARHGRPDWNDPRYRQELKIRQQFKKDFYPEINLTYLLTSHDPYVRVFVDTSQKSGELTSDEISADSSLVGYWKLNSVNSTNWTLDETANANHGEVHTNGTPSDPGDSFVSAKFGKGMQFDGVDDYVDCGNDTSLDITDEITIEAWVKFDFVNSTINTPIVVNRAGYEVFLFLQGGEGTFQFTIWGNPSGQYNAPTTITPTIDTWYHVVGTFDGTNLKIYINGREEGNGDIVNPWKGVDTGFTIGYTPQQGIYLNGTIDEVRIYNRALSAEEIAEHYYRGAGSHNLSVPVQLGQNKTMLDQGLVGYWSFEEDDGNYAYDYSGKANTGTLHNGSGVCHDGDCPTWTTGKFGSALSFDGSNDYVDCGNDESLNITDAITIEAWVKPNYISTSWGQFFLGRYVAFSSPCHLVIGTRDRHLDIGRSTHWWTNFVIEANNWYHIVYTFDESSGVSKAYVNGDMQSSSFDPGLSSCGSHNFWINGDLPEGGKAPLNGTIDEVRIYNRALSAEEVWQRYKLGQSKHAPGNYYYRNSTSDSVLFTAQNMKQAYRGPKDDPISSNFNIIEEASNSTQDLPKLTYNYSFNATQNQNFMFSLGYAKAQNTVNFSSWNGSMSLGFSGEDLEQVAKSTLTYYDLKDDSLVGYWDFDDAGNYSGHEYSEIIEVGKTMDRSGHGNHGTIHGATWTRGKFGSALKFEGSEDTSVYVEVPDSASLKQTRYLTVEAWVKGNNGFIAKKYDPSADQRSWFLCFSGSDHEILFDIHGGTSTPYYQEETQTGITDNNWHHIVGVVVDAQAEDKMKIYIDGTEQATDVYTYDTIDEIFAGTAPVQIGYAYNCMVTIDEVRIYNRALSAEEIRAHYEAGREAHDGGAFDTNTTLGAQHEQALSFKYGGIAKDGLVLGMTFDEGNGSTARDISFYENDGTINGATWTTDTPSGRGYALSFDGENDYVDCGDDESLNINDEITIEAWVKPYEKSLSKYYIVGFEADVNHLYGFGFDGEDSVKNGKLFFVNYGFWTQYSTQAVITELNKWYFIAVTYDRTNVKFYKDGVFLSAHPQNDPIKGEVVLIGKKWNTNYFNGTIDELRIYNRALSPEEIRAHYQASAPRHAVEDGVSSGVGYADDFNAGANKFFGVENATNNWSAPVDSSCVLAIKMDENSGTTAHDSSAYGNDGTIHGANWTTGKFGSALSFDGSNDYVDCGNDESLKISNEITVATWIKPDSMSGLKVIMSKRYSFELDRSGSNKINFYIGDGSWWKDHVTTTSSYTLDKWTHVVGVYDGSKLKIYIDGNLDNSKSTSATFGTNTEHLYIGNGIGSYYFHGMIDEVRIYNRALSDEEIRAHYEQGLVGNRTTGSGGEHKVISLSDHAPSALGNQSAFIASYNLTDTDSAGMQNYDQRLLKITGEPNLNMTLSVSKARIKVGEDFVFRANVCAVHGLGANNVTATISYPSDYFELAGGESESKTNSVAIPDGGCYQYNWSMFHKGTTGGSYTINVTLSAEDGSRTDSKTQEVGYVYTLLTLMGTVSDAGTNDPILQGSLNITIYEEADQSGGVAWGPYVFENEIVNGRFNLLLGAVHAMTLVSGKTYNMSIWLTNETTWICGTKCEEFTTVFTP